MSNKATICEIWTKPLPHIKYIYHFQTWNFSGGIFSLINGQNGLQSLFLKLNKKRLKKSLKFTSSTKHYHMYDFLISFLDKVTFA
jgi:hypothetical protein